MDAARVALTAVFVVAAIIDVRTRRIPNVLTFGAAAAGLAVQAWANGLPGIAQAVGGWATGVAVFLPIFLVGGMGAGDVKLLGAAGAWLGPLAALWSGFYSVMAGGVLALGVGAWHGYLGKAFANVWGLLGFWRAAGIRPVPGLTLADAKGPRLPYGVAIAVGTIAVIWFT